MHTTIDMTWGRPLPLLVRFGTPLMLTALLRQLYSFCDSLIIGRLLGLEAFAAIGACAFLVALPQSMLLGLSIGYETVLAQLFGAGDPEGFSLAKKRALGIGFWGAVGISLLLIALRKPLLVLLGTPVSLMEPASDYLLVIFAGLFVYSMFDWAASCLRACGDSRTPLRAVLYSSILNILVDLLLTVVFPMGVMGPAIGTLAAQLLAVFLCLRAMKKGPEAFPPAAPQKPDGSTRRLLQLGLPPMLRDGIIALGGLFIQSRVNLFGVELVAGMAAANVYFSLLIMAGDGIEGSIATFVGQNTGAGQTQRIRWGTRTALVLALLSSCAFALLAWCAAPWLIGAITGTADTLTLGMGVHALRCMAVFLPFLYLLCMYRAVLQSMGDAVTPMLSGITELVMRLLCVFTLPGLIGHTAPCIAEGCGWLFAAILLVTRYILFMRKRK